MGRINDNSKYNKDTSLIGDEQLFGSDSDGTSKNYELDELKDFFNTTSSGGDQNNIVRVVSTHMVTTDDYDIAGLINAGQYFWSSTQIAILDTWIMLFKVPVLLQKGSTQDLYYDYFLLINQGEGTIGPASGTT
jgi:hypothetical protein